MAHERKDRCDRPQVEGLFIGEKRMGKGERGDWPLGSGVAEEERRGGDGKKVGGEERERREVDRGCSECAQQMLLVVRPVRMPEQPQF